MNQTTSSVSQSNALGIASFVVGLISIFMLSIITVPLSVILGLLGLRHPQKVWSILGLVCAAIGFVTSPILMGIFGLVTI